MPRMDMARQMNVKIIELPRITDPRGNLSIVEENINIPFRISRVYWIYDVPGGQFRGSHAYRQNQEFIVALSGSFDVIIHDGRTEKRFSLNRSYYGLYVPPLKWRSLDNFSTNALCLILASGHYSPEDYIRDFQLYKNLINAKFKGD